ncbi:hypothetical protein BDZ89DRAFT_1041838 [Hymenopellis radicata]|nr:hypothetical protein BDZ89DRAFT_1041838 [Hymenopellis radicata]
MPSSLRFLDLEAANESSDYESDDASLQTLATSSSVTPLPSIGGMTRFHEDLDGIIERYENNSDTLDNTPRGQQSVESDDEDEDRLALAVRSFDEDSLRKVAFNNNLCVVRYKFSQSGTAKPVLRRLMSFQRIRHDLQFDIMDAWIMPNEHSKSIYLLLDLNPPPTKSISPYTSLSSPAPLQFPFSRVDDFIRKHFVTLDVNSRYVVEDFHDRLACLRHRKSHRQTFNGKWVEIRGGRFNGDIGFAVKGDLYYDILVLPRIPPNAQRWSLTRSTRHLPNALLLIQNLTFLASVKLPSFIPPPHHNHDLPPPFFKVLATPRSLARFAISMMGPMTIINLLHLPLCDLQLLKIHRNRLKPALAMLSFHRDLFIHSTNTHIDKSVLPLPMEWTFHVGELVEDLSKEPSPNVSGSVGTILDVQPNSLSIGFTYGGQTVEMSRAPIKILKVFHLGDFVEVCHADTIIRSGSVVGVGRKSLDLLTRTEVDDTVSVEADYHRAAASRRAEIPFGLRRAQVYASNKLVQSRPVYTLREHGVVTLQYTAKKANMIDVDFDKDDESGLSIVVRLYGNVNNNVVEKKYSYMDIADERTGWPLRVVYPLSARQQLRGFAGNIEYFELEQNIAWFTRMDVRPGPSISGDTHINDPNDPNSTHWLMLPCLDGHKVEVFWTQSSAKRPRSFTVEQVKIGSEIAIYQCANGESLGKRISPWNLRPKNPGHKPDKDKRWMCIAGQHKGTFWRDYNTTSHPKNGRIYPPPSTVPLTIVLSPIMNKSEAYTLTQKNGKQRIWQYIPYRPSPLLRVSIHCRIVILYTSSERVSPGSPFTLAWIGLQQNKLIGWTDLRTSSSLVRFETIRSLGFIETSQVYWYSIPMKHLQKAFTGILAVHTLILDEGHGYMDEAEMDVYLLKTFVARFDPLEPDFQTSVARESHERFYPQDITFCHAVQKLGSWFTNIGHSSSSPHIQRMTCIDSFMHNDVALSLNNVIQDVDLESLALIWDFEHVVDIDAVSNANILPTWTRLFNHPQSSNIQTLRIAFPISEPILDLRLVALYNELDFHVNGHRTRQIHGGFSSIR